MHSLLRPPVLPPPKCLCNGPGKMPPHGFAAGLPWGQELHWCKDPISSPLLGSEVAYPMFSCAKQSLVLQWHQLADSPSEGRVHTFTLPSTCSEPGCTLKSVHLSKIQLLQKLPENHLICNIPMCWSLTLAMLNWLQQWAFNMCLCKYRTRIENCSQKLPKMFFFPQDVMNQIGVLLLYINQVARSYCI